MSSEVIMTDDVSLQVSVAVLHIPSGISSKASPCTTRFFLCQAMTSLRFCAGVPGPPKEAGRAVVTCQLLVGVRQLTCLGAWPEEIAWGAAHAAAGVWLQ